MTAAEVAARLRSGTATREDSDAVLLACGWRKDPHASIPRWAWTSPAGKKVLAHRPDPARNLQDAVDLVPPDWRIFIEKLPIDNGNRWTALVRPHAGNGYDSDWCESAAQAVCLTLMEAKAAQDNQGGADE